MNKILCLLCFIFISTSCAGSDLVFNNYMQEGVDYYNSKQYSKAISKLTKAISIDQTNFEAYLFRGHSYAEIRNFEMAYSDYQKVIELNPENSEAYFYQGVVLSEAGKLENSIKFWFFRI